MPFCCKRCNKPFKDNYNLNRHNNRKTPCALIKNEAINDSSGNTFINNGTININISLGQENLSNFNTETLIESWRNINHNTSEDYTRANKLIISFHGMVKNNNVSLASTKAMTGQYLTASGWVTEPADETINRVIKVRSGQLIAFKDTINHTNDKVFKSEPNQRTWKHLELFHTLGRDHQGVGDQTRRARSAIKVMLTE